VPACQIVDRAHGHPAGHVDDELREPAVAILACLPVRTSAIR
jgi:hypothetical protein